MRQTPYPIANCFIALCDDLGASLPLSGASLLATENQVIRHLPGLVMEPAVLQAGLMNSGSLRIARATKACTPPTDWARFVLRKYTIPTSVSQNADPAFFTFLSEIGLGTTVALALTFCLISRDDPTLLDLVLRCDSAPSHRVLISALCSAPGPVDPIQALAVPVATALLETRSTHGGYHALLRVLRAALSHRDRRLVSAVLTLGLDMSGHSVFSSDPRLIDLVNRSGSAHGRLWLQRNEPDLVALLARDADARFHDLGPEPT